MPACERIAIVGGGPSGAFAASQLAGSGREVLLFDEKLAWEKPCGGGITDKALQRWPCLREAQIERNWIRDCQLIAPSGRKANFRLDRQIAIYSRRTLNGFLLERAKQAGARLVRQRILNISRNGKNWRLQSARRAYEADFVVLASGARNSLRSLFAPPLGPENFMVAAGYFIPVTSNTVQVKFLKDLHGYIWLFPRADHLSAGICGRMKGKSTAELRKLLEGWLGEIGISLVGAQFYAHIIPSLSVSAWKREHISGDGWAAVGDAAGFVDAITGEGIYYALRSAEMLSEALLRDAPETYTASVEEDFLPELEHAARIADRFYSGEWLGGAVIEQMVRLTARSDRFRDLMRDLFAGSQGYSDLRQRLYRSLPAIAAQALVSTLWSGFASGHHADTFAGVGSGT